jgi:hypothetical protein
MKLAQIGRVEAARAALILGAAANPGSWSARTLAGRAHLHAGDTAAGLAELRTALNLARSPAARDILTREISAVEAG